MLLSPVIIRDDFYSFYAQYHKVQLIIYYLGGETGGWGFQTQ